MLCDERIATEWKVVRKLLRRLNDLVIELVEVSAARFDPYLHIPLSPRRSPVPESGTTVTLSCGCPRFIVPLCCNTNVPLCPPSVPFTISIAT